VPALRPELLRWTSGKAQARIAHSWLGPLNRNRVGGRSRQTWFATAKILPPRRVRKVPVPSEAFAPEVRGCPPDGRDEDHVNQPQYRDGCRNCPDAKQHASDQGGMQSDQRAGCGEHPDPAHVAGNSLLLPQILLLEHACDRTLRCKATKFPGEGTVTCRRLAEGYVYVRRRSRAFEPP